MEEGWKEHNEEVNAKLEESQREWTQAKNIEKTHRAVRERWK